MSRDRTQTPAQQEQKTARANEAPASGPMRDSRQNAQPGQQSAEQESGRRNMGEETSERKPEHRSPKRADETEKQGLGQQGPDRNRDERHG